MVKRYRKPPITPEQRRDWLRRYEDGETQIHIVQEDHVDIRTVRKQIEMARAEREAKDARTLVLRSAIEQHYGDMLRYAERLDAAIRADTEIEQEPDDPFVESALRQHLPRSILWQHIARRKTLRQDEVSQRRRLGDVVRGAAEADGVLSSLARAVNGDIIQRVTEAVMVQVPVWLDGNMESSFKDRLSYQSEKEGLVNPMFGLAHMGVMEETLARKEMPRVRRALEDLERRAKNSPEFAGLRSTAEELKGLNEKIREELAVIRLRRIVPGKCSFCPL
jgi:hypothetical protein